ncbi:hypothetical protein [Methylibium sp.]|uniref:hypothetical protein n=1 Tax=Methylibium sp. TaxID=2067992 RepID=UPI003BAAE327
MDVFYFLKERTVLIRHFYETSSAPFTETKCLIEHAEAPFDNPPYDESGESAYLAEWLQADVELELVGRACVSMLSDALKQFFVTWERRMWSDRPCQKCFPKEFNDGGFWAGYVACFAEAIGLDWSECPADLAVLEQVVLARNRAQHADLLSSSLSHDDKTRSKFQHPFFMRPEDFDLAADSSSFMAPSLHIAATSVFHAIEQVEQLGDWFQRHAEVYYYRRRVSDA